MLARLLSRPRLCKKLENLLLYPLSIVHAPIGYGKTTAVEQHFSGRDDVFAVWVPLAGGGGSPDYLWTRLCEQLRRAGLALGAQLQKQRFPGDTLQMGKVLDMLIDYEYERPTAIIFDDFQVMTDNRAFSLIKMIARARIDKLHIVLITRDFSRLDAAALYQNQLCFTLTEKSLKFTREEIGGYFELMGCPLEEKQLDEVWRYTDGWISMVYILLGGIQRGLPAGKNSTVNDIIEQNLYSALDARAKEALQKLSFFESFTLPMAVYVLDTPDAPQLLEAVIRTGTFFVCNEADQSYRIRNLLREFLEERARMNGLDRRLLWSRAGHWYLNEGQHAAAFEALFRAGETESILAELGREDTPDIHFTQFKQMHRIFAGLDQALCLKYPLAYLQYIRILALSGEAGSMARCRDSLIRMEEFIRLSGMDERRRRFLMGELNVVWTFVVFNDLPKMIQHNRQAAEYFSGGCSCIVTRKKEFTFGSPHLLYCYYREPGQLRRTADFLINGSDSLISSIGGCGTGSDAVVMAEYALETGDFDHVELYAYKAIYKAKSAGQLCLSICAKLTLARLAILRGGSGEGEALMDSLRKEVQKENNPVLSTAFELSQAYVNLCLGRLDAVPSWIRTDELSRASFFIQGRSFYEVVRGKAILLAEDYIRLDAQCETSLPAFQRFQNRLGLLHNLIHEAVAKWHLQGADAGLRPLCRALEQAERDGIVMPFVENAPALLEMLREAQRREPRPYVARLIGLCEEYLCRVGRLRVSKVLLTAREVEILQLLEQGYKHDEIGERLFISVTTVRYHIKNIYQKLQVNNKVLAIKKAAELGFI